MEGGTKKVRPTWGHTAEPRAAKMRALRAEAGRAAKADMDAARERCAVPNPPTPPKILTVQPP